MPSFTNRTSFTSLSWFVFALRRTLTRIAYEQKVPLRGLVCAGLNAVFAQHHKPEIAR